MLKTQPRSKKNQNGPRTSPTGYGNARSVPTAFLYKKNENSTTVPTVGHTDHRLVTENLLLGARVTLLNHSVIRQQQPIKGMITYDLGQ